MSEGVFWDYEEGSGYYHVYTCSGPLEVLESIIEVQSKPEVKELEPPR